jgi:hypothetical protein
MDLFDALFTQPIGDFEIGYDGGAGLLGNVAGIGQMVIMAVGNEDIVGFDFFDIDPFGERVLPDEGVKEEMFAADFGGETRMAVVGDFHSIPFSL